MEALLLGLAALAVVVVVLMAIRGKQAAFQSHVQQLQKAPPKPKRELVVGRWTREEVRGGRAPRA